MMISTGRCEMKKSIFKIVVICILMVAILNICLTSTVMARGIIDPTDPSWKPSAATGMEGLEKKGNHILGIVQAAGTVISVIALTLIGIKYVTGSVEDKAEYKKTMIPYIIGAVMLFAASNLVQVIYNWANTLNS